MLYHSSNNSARRVPLKEAILRSLPLGNGLAPLPDHHGPTSPNPLTPRVVRNAILAAIPMAIIGITASASPRPVIQTLHASDPYTVAYSPDGSLVATVSRAGELKVWNRQDLSLVGCYGSAPSMARELAFSPSSRYFAFSSSDEIFLWNRVDASLHKHWFGSEGRTFSFDSKQDIILIGGPQGIQCFNLPDLKLTAKWAPPNNAAVHHIGTSHDGRVFAHLNDDRFVKFRSTNLKNPAMTGPLSLARPFYSLIPDAHSCGFLVHRFKGLERIDLEASDPLVSAISKTLWIAKPEISPDGTKLAVGFPGGVKILDSKSGKVLASHRLAASPNSFSWSPVSGEIAIATSTSGTIFINPLTGDQSASLDPGVFFGSEDSMGVNCSSSNDGRLLILAGDDGILRFLSIGETIELRTTSAPGGTPSLVHARSKDSVCTYKSGALHFWNPKDPATPEAEALKLPAWQYGRNSGGIWFRSDKGLKVIKNESADRDQPTRFAIPNRGPLSITSSFNLVVCQPPETERFWTVLQAPRWESTARIPASRAQQLFPESAFDPRSSSIFSVDQNLGVIRSSAGDRKWSQVLPDFKAHSFTSSSISESGRRFAVKYASDQSGTMIVDPARGKIMSNLKPWNQSELNHSPDALAFFNDDQYLWATGIDGRPILYQADTGEPQLRVTTWNDGAWIAETIAGEFHGNHEGLSRLIWIDPESGRSVPDRELTKSKHKPELVSGLLKGYLGNATTAAD